MRHHDDWNRTIQAIVEIAQETLTDTEELVGGRSRDSYLDPFLEATPEGAEVRIRRHGDRKPEEPDNQGYSAPQAE